MIDSADAEKLDIEKIQIAFTKWWEAEQQEAADLAAVSPSSDELASVMKPIIEIDSHRAVRALLEVEEIVGCDIPPRVVKMGGYTSFEEMSEHLVAELEKMFVSKKEKADA